MEDILMDIRHAQWRWGFAAQAHGASFHSSGEVARIVSSAIGIAQESRIKLARLLADLGHNKPVPYPDISTKSKAQEFVGLDMEKLRNEKEEFLNTVVPKWEEEAATREALYEVENL
jgi:nitrite reductase (cytochrome c-552)